MGRTLKTDFDFFRMATGFFSNKKIKALRRRFGSVGILTYLYILSYAYGNDGYYIKIESVEDFAYDIAESIANSNLTQVATVATDCINYMASRGEINKHLLDIGVISGESIQRQYIEMCVATKRRVEIKKEYRLVDIPYFVAEKIPISSEEMAISSEEMAISSEEMQQSKVNKNKEIIKEREKREKDGSEYFLSLSQNKSMQAVSKELKKRIEESEFLKQMSESWVKEHTEEILSGKYKSFKKEDMNARFKGERKYGENEFNSVLTDIDNFDF